MKILEVASVTGQGNTTELAKKAIGMIAYDLESLTHLIAYSNCPEYTCPSFASLIAYEANLTHLVAFDVNSSRLSFFNWLKLNVDSVYLGVEVLVSTRHDMRASVVIFAPDTFTGGLRVNSEVNFALPTNKLNLEGAETNEVEESVVVDATILSANASPICEFWKIKDRASRFVWREEYGLGCIEIR